MNELICVWIGIVIGITINLAINIKHSHGVLKIDKTNPEKDSYLFEIDDIDKLEKEKWIRLTIVKKE